jgi:hypothetical protein
VVKGIFKTEKSNRDFCSVKIITQVELECLKNKIYNESEIGFDEPDLPMLREHEPVAVRAN